MALLSVEDALARVLQDASPLPAETVPVAEAYGRVLALDVASRRTQPPENLSAMDGYAVRAADVAAAPATLRIVGEVSAGHPFGAVIGPGQAARIFTGGVMPPGADTVVIQENTTRDGDRVTCLKGSPAGRHVRSAGLDFAVGDVLLRAGHRFNDRSVMLSAAMNHPVVPVHRRARVGVLATGDELVPPGSTPGPGQIVYSNGFGLLALARREGSDAVDLGIAPDRIEETVAAIRRARSMGLDVLVTTGGASVGEYDLVQRALAAEGLTLSFWKVALRPGRPLMHGRLGAMHVLGLPGNPVSAYVCGLLFLIPLIRRLAGRSDLTLPVETAELGIALAANDERTDYLRARLAQEGEGLPVATPFPVQDSSMLAPLAQADCLLIREPHAPPAAAGSPCSIVKLPL